MKCYTFEDDGQDFMQWYVSDKGIILDSQPFQGSTWVGKELVVKNYRKGQCLEFAKGNVSGMLMKHRIKSVRTLTKKEEAETIGIYGKWKKIQADKK